MNSENALQVALESDLAHDLAHLAVDPFDLPEPDLVDLGWRVVRGRDRPHVVRIPGRTVRQCVETNRGTALRQVLIAHVAEKLPVGRHDLAADRGAIRRGEPIPVRGREPGRHVAQRAEVDRVLGCRDHMRLELRQDALGEYARQGIALRDSLAHVGNRLIGPGDESIQPLEEIVVILDGVKRLYALARAHHREAVGRRIELVERQQVLGKAVPLDFQLAPRLEHVVGQQVLSGETTAIDGREPCERVALDTLGSRAPLRGDRDLEAIVVSRIADRGREQRVELELLLEILVEQYVQLLRLGACVYDGRWRRRALSGRGLRRVRGAGRKQGGGTGRQRQVESHAVPRISTTSA